VNLYSLGLKYIDWVTSVTNCLENFVEKSKSSAEARKLEGGEGTGGADETSVVTGGGATIDLTKIDNAHVALRLEIERVIRVSKKMKDDAVFELKDVVFDKHLLSILPKNLVQEAIAAQLSCEEQCQKRKW
jgi:hypothetical protein